ncbi:MAG: hypothetical protein GF349_02295 [Candidatus Magasanikbacteria bacterium]|nr:hypothetical protein [Candidatus Magasanikbacteria bacterium]
MKLICPECKNEVNLDNYPDLEKGQVIECDMCGITLVVNEIEGSDVKVEIIDEGK